MDDLRFAARMSETEALVWSLEEHDPRLRPTIAVVLLLRSMDLLRVFDSIFILTQGGPGFATETASLFIYRTAFRFYDFGYAAVLSFVVLAVTTLMARTLLRFLGGSRA